MNHEFERFRRRFDSIPAFTAYLRMDSGGLLFIQDSRAAEELQSGLPMEDFLPEDYDLTFDERTDILILKEERLVKVTDVTIADGVQDNLSMKRSKRSSSGSGSVTLSNHDYSISSLWSKEPLLGREVIVRFGFIGLAYIYYAEVNRGVIETVQYAKNKVILSLG
ncbi:MAG: hypothetical protein HQM11_07625 [SAR324 cluster bacterium]|nr:hypothetical protein [SAR324 cluster bacterium]